MKLLRQINTHTLSVMGLITALISTPSVAIDWEREDYQFYSGDYDNNGTTDLVIKPAPRILIIHGDVAIPIDISTESYLVTPTTVDGDGQFNVDRTVVTSSWSQNYTPLYADFDGDGHQDALLQPNATGDALLIYGGDLSSIAIDQKLGAAQFGLDLTKEHVSLSTSDLNNDGKLDLIVTEPGGPSMVIYMSDSGFQPVDNKYSESGNITELLVDSSSNSVFIKHDGFSSFAWSCPDQTYAILSPSSTMFNEIYFQLVSAQASGSFIDLHIRGCSNTQPSRPIVTHTRIQK